MSNKDKEVGLPHKYENSNNVESQNLEAELLARSWESGVANIVHGSRINDIAEVYQAISENPDCINEVDANGMTSLFYAVSMGHNRIAEVFLENDKTDYTWTDNNGHNYSQIAARSLTCHPQVAFKLHHIIYDSPSTWEFKLK